MGAHEGAFLQALLEALVAGGDVLAGDGAADDLVDKFLLAIFQGLDVAGNCIL